MIKKTLLAGLVATTAMTGMAYATTVNVPANKVYTALDTSGNLVIDETVPGGQNVRGLYSSAVAGVSAVERYRPLLRSRAGSTFDLADATAAITSTRGGQGTQQFNAYTYHGAATTLAAAGTITYTHTDGTTRSNTLNAIQCGHGSDVTAGAVYDSQVVSYGVRLGSIRSFNFSQSAGTRAANQCATVGTDVVSWLNGGRLPTGWTASLTGSATPEVPESDSDDQQIEAQIVNVTPFVSKDDAGRIYVRAHVGNDETMPRQAHTRYVTSNSNEFIADDFIGKQDRYDNAEFDYQIDRDGLILAIEAVRTAQNDVDESTTPPVVETPEAPETDIQHYTPRADIRHFNGTSFVVRVQSQIVHGHNRFTDVIVLDRAGLVSYLENGMDANDDDGQYTYEITGNSSQAAFDNAVNRYNEQEAARNAVFDVTVPAYVNAVVNGDITVKVLTDLSDPVGRDVMDHVTRHPGKFGIHLISDDRLRIKAGSGAEAISKFEQLLDVVEAGTDRNENILHNLDAADIDRELANYNGGDNQAQVDVVKGEWVDVDPTSKAKMIRQMREVTTTTTTQRSGRYADRDPIVDVEVTVEYRTVINNRWVAKAEELGDEIADKIENGTTLTATTKHGIEIGINTTSHGVTLSKEFSKGTKKDRIFIKPRAGIHGIGNNDDFIAQSAGVEVGYENEEIRDLKLRFGYDSGDQIRFKGSKDGYTGLSGHTSTQESGYVSFEQGADREVKIYGRADTAGRGEVGVKKDGKSLTVNNEGKVQANWTFKF